MLKTDRDWWRCHWIDWEISVCSKTTPKTPGLLSGLTVCFSVCDAAMMRFMRDVVKMPYITLPSNVTSSVCWLLSAFCLCVSYCLSTYRVIYLVRIFLYSQKNFVVYIIAKAFRIFFYFGKLYKVWVFVCGFFFPPSVWCVCHFVWNLYESRGFFQRLAKTVVRNKMADHMQT